MPKKIEVSDEMWEKLRLEYISSEISLRGLEKKYGVPFTQIQKRAKSGQWAKLREEFKSQKTQKSIDLIAEHQVNDCARAFRIANAVMDKLEEVVMKIDPNDEYAVKELKEATIAIKNLKEIGLFRSALDHAEQEARINKLRKDVEEDNDTTIEVIIDDEVKKYCR